MCRPASAFWVPVLYTNTDSPLGSLLLLGDGACLRGLYMQDGLRAKPIEPSWRHEPRAFVLAIAQLGEYFNGERTAFELALKPRGPPFQLHVWRALCEVDFGETTTYGALAQRIKPMGTPRGVGSANGANPISIIIPCHRVIGADGSLTGYAGGIERKRLLLELEAERTAPRLP